MSATMPIEWQLRRFLLEFEGVRKVVEGAWDGYSDESRRGVITLLTMFDAGKHLENAQNRDHSVLLLGIQELHFLTFDVKYAIVGGIVVGSDSRANYANHFGSAATAGRRQPKKDIAGENFYDVETQVAILIENGIVDREPFVEGRHIPFDVVQQRSGDKKITVRRGFALMDGAALMKLLDRTQRVRRCHLNTVPAVVMHHTDSDGKLSFSPFCNLTLKFIRELGTKAARTRLYGGPGDEPLLDIEPIDFIHGALHAQGSVINALVIRPIGQLVLELGARVGKKQEIFDAWKKSVERATGMPLQVDEKDGDFLDVRVKTGLAIILLYKFPEALVPKEIFSGVYERLSDDILRWIKDLVQPAFLIYQTTSLEEQKEMFPTNYVTLTAAVEFLINNFDHTGQASTFIIDLARTQRDALLRRCIEKKILIGNLDETAVESIHWVSKIMGIGDAVGKNTSRNLKDPVLGKAMTLKETLVNMDVWLHEIGEQHGKQPATLRFEARVKRRGRRFQQLKDARNQGETDVVDESDDESPPIDDGSLDPTAGVDERGDGEKQSLLDVLGAYVGDGPVPTVEAFLKTQFDATIGTAFDESVPPMMDRLLLYFKGQFAALTDDKLEDAAWERIKEEVTKAVTNVASMWNDKGPAFLATCATKSFVEKFREAVSREALVAADNATTVEEAPAPVPTPLDVANATGSSRKFKFRSQRGADVAEVAVPSFALNLDEVCIKDPDGGNADLAFVWSQFSPKLHVSLRQGKFEFEVMKGVRLVVKLTDVAACRVGDGSGNAWMLTLCQIAKPTLRLATDAGTWKTQPLIDTKTQQLSGGLADIVNGMNVATSTTWVITCSYVDNRRRFEEAVFSQSTAMKDAREVDVGNFPRRLNDPTVVARAHELHERLGVLQVVPRLIGGLHDTSVEELRQSINEKMYDRVKHYDDGEPYESHCPTCSRRLIREKNPTDGRLPGVAYIAADEMAWPGEDKNLLVAGKLEHPPVCPALGLCLALHLNEDGSVDHKDSQLRPTTNSRYRGPPPTEESMPPPPPPSVAPAVVPAVVPPSDETSSAPAARSTRARRTRTSFSNNPGLDKALVLSIIASQDGQSSRVPWNAVSQQLRSQFHEFDDDDTDGSSLNKRWIALLKKKNLTVHWATDGPTMEQYYKAKKLRGNKT